MLTQKTNKSLLILSALLIVGTLVNINIFGPITLSAYFFYTILGSLLAVIAGVGFIKSKQAINLGNSLPLIILGLLAAYYILNGLINTQGGINLRHYIILVDAVLLASYCILLSKGSINLLAISKIITLIVAFESILCILQQLKIIPNLNSLFTVTGSNVNPNVTAMFLAMAVPALLLVLFQGSKTYRIVAIISSILCIIALVLLQCRSAFIGTVVSIILIANYQYQLINKLKSKFSKAVLLITGIIATIIIALAFLFLYHSKQASSDGRLFIWKISLQAIAKKPIFGSGYGQFEHDYNLAQANYFATKTATQEEIYNASYVHMSYNEFLENLFEGGGIGLVLFVLLLATLLFSPPAPLKDGSGSIIAKESSQKAVLVSTSKMGHQKKNIEFSHKFSFMGQGFFAYAGIVTFTTMCFFNFTVQALPVRALFVLYTGVCCVESKSNQYLDLATFKKLSNLVRINLIPYALCLTAISLFLFFKILTISKAYSQCNTILETENDLDRNDAIQEMAALKGDLSQSTHYLRGYAQMLLSTKHFDAAIEKYNKALNYSSDPSLYMDIGNCYSKRGRYKEAELAYSVAANIEPHRFAPKYGLMKLYGFAKDSSNAKLIAQQIIIMNPKVASDKVEYYKKEARKLIEN